MAEELKVTIKKDKSWRNISYDMDKILTILSNTVKIDLSDKSEYPTLDVTGEFSSDYGIVALSCEKLQTPRTIKLVGDATGNVDFDGSSNVDINVSVKKIGGSNIDDLYTTVNNIKVSKDTRHVTTSIGTDVSGNEVNINQLFQCTDTTTVGSTSTNNGNETPTLTNLYAAQLSIATMGFRYNGANIPISNVFNLSNGALVAKSASSIVNNNNVEFSVDDVAFKSLSNTFKLKNTFTNGLISNGDITISENASLIINSTSNTAGSFNKSSDNSLDATSLLNYNGYFRAHRLYATDILDINGVQLSKYTGTNGGLYVNGNIHASKVYNAVYNDYAECFEPIPHFKYLDNLHRIVEIIDGKIQLASEYSKAVVGIVSDNYGYLLGGEIEEIENNVKIPVGLSGVLFVDAENKVSKKDLYKFIVSAGEGKARPLNSYENILHFGEMVGKIIGIDEENNRYKILLAIR